MAFCLRSIRMCYYFYSTGGKFWILQSYTLLLKLPVLMWSCVWMYGEIIAWAADSLKPDVNVLRKAKNSVHRLNQSLFCGHSLQWCVYPSFLCFPPLLCDLIKLLPIIWTCPLRTEMSYLCDHCMLSAKLTQHWDCIIVFEVWKSTEPTSYSVTVPRLYISFWRDRVTSSMPHNLMSFFHETQGVKQYLTTEELQLRIL